MKILIIAQHIFPITTPRAHRTTELVKELSRQGHSVVVYAVLGRYNYRSFEDQYNVVVKPIPVRFQIIPYTSDGAGKRHFIDKVLGRLFGKLFEFPYIEFLFSIPKIIQKEPNVDILLSISEPHHIHWGCSHAKKNKTINFPPIWIADSGDPFMDNGLSKSHIKFYERYEREFCSLCNYLAVPALEAINGYFPEYREKIKVIPQGFSFPLPIHVIEPQNEALTFAYAGMFYKDIRNPKKFLEFLSTINIDFQFVVYTPHKGVIMEYTKRLNGKLIIKDPIDRSELIEELKKMDFLVNIQNLNSPNQIPSKLIDYALTGRPILSINPENMDIAIINEFLVKNYSHKLLVPNIEQYHISNVVDKFIQLMK